MTKGLNRVHRQRIASAAEEAKRGATVVFLVLFAPVGAGFGQTGARVICQVNGRAQTIAAGGKCAMEAMLPEAQAEFVRRMAEAPETAELVAG